MRRMRIGHSNRLCSVVKFAQPALCPTRAYRPLAMTVKGEVYDSRASLTISERIYQRLKRSPGIA